MGPIVNALSRLRGFVVCGSLRGHATADHAGHPAAWRYLSVYDFSLETPAIDIPALGPLVAERATRA